MNRSLLMSGAVAAILCGAPLLAAADEYNVSAATTQLADTTMSGEVDAGKLIGEEVYDAAGEKVGEIDSVMVGAKGKVTAVVLDVSGWLESEKLVAVKWTDLQTVDGKIVSSLTRENAKAAAAYAYKDPALRKQVLTESGERYVAEGAPADGTTTTETQAVAVDASTNDPILNANGSLNASKLIGLDVQSPEDKKVGDIGEVVLDKAGKVDGVVVDVGGFLGIATHPVLLEWKDVTLASQDGKTKAIVNLTKENLEQMPAYETSSK